MEKKSRSNFSSVELELEALTSGAVTYLYSRYVMTSVTRSCFL